MTHESGMVTETLYIVDYDNRRAIIRITIDDKQTILRRVNGRSQMFMDGEEIDMSEIPGMVDPFALTFNPDAGVRLRGCHLRRIRLIW